MPTNHHHLDRHVIHRLYAALSWMAVGLGVVHIAATPRYAPQFTQASLWFASGGLVMILAGMLNLLNRTYGRTARGLRWAAIGTSAVTTTFGAFAGALGHATLAEFVLVLGIFVGCTVGSVLPAARLRS